MRAEYAQVDQGEFTPHQPGSKGANLRRKRRRGCPTLLKIAASINAKGTDVATWKISHSCSGCRG
jgi:hypothetical protein